MISHEQLVLFQRQADEFWRFTLGEFRAKGGVLACAEGCFHCCKAYAQCSEAEAERIASAMLDDPEGLGAFEERIDQYLRELSAKWSGEGWRGIPDFEARAEMHFRLDMRCPFLTEENRCAAYALRPYACRSHWVAGSSDACASPETVSRALKIEPTAESTARFAEKARSEGRAAEFADFDETLRRLADRSGLALLAVAVKLALMRLRRAS